MTAPKDPMAPYVGLILAMLIGLAVCVGITYALIQTAPDATVACDNVSVACPA